MGPGDAKVQESRSDFLARARQLRCTPLRTCTLLLFRRGQGFPLRSPQGRRLPPIAKAASPILGAFLRPWGRDRPATGGIVRFREWPIRITSFNTSLSSSCYLCPNSFLSCDTSGSHCRDESLAPPLFGLGLRMTVEYQ